MAPWRSASTLAVLLVCTAATVRADPYQGVTAGSGTEPPHAQALAKGQARLVTWPGFQMRPDGSSRVFLQTTSEPRFETKKEPGRFVLVLKDTRVFLRNNRRPLETRFFNTPVTRVKLQRRGKDVAVVVSLRADVTPHVHTEPGPDGRFHYVLMDFPTGQWVAGAPAAEPSETQQAPSEPSSSSGSGDDGVHDDEKPPGMN